MSSSTPDVKAIARYLHEIGHLKHSKRSGWWLAGIKDPESVAEHSFRTAVVGYVLALMEGADPNATAALCLFHDSLETRLGDIPSSSKQYISGVDNKAIAVNQLVGFPSSVHDRIVDLLEDYQSQRSHEAQLAKDADLLECLIQAREYEEQGYWKTREWTTNTAAKLQSDAAKKLAAACQAGPFESWWNVVAQDPDPDSSAS